MVATENLIESLSQVAAAYDETPYVSKAITQSQPGRMAAIAQLFGLRPKAPSVARVLELGSAEGGNIIPLAARFPKAEFVGIDISAVQIERGLKRIAELGIKNCKLEVKSITDIGADFGQFDYIICHGIFSWVPRAVQDAIFNVVRQNLTPSGIGYVSYNVLPGWRVKQPFRDLAATVSKPGADTVAQAKAAAETLNFLASHANHSTAYGRSLIDLAQGISAASPQYLVHEFLADTNEPCTFKDFINRANDNSLGYLGDATLSTMVPQGIQDQTAQEIMRRTGGDLLATEQLLDLMTGRMFRSSLLVHKHALRNINRSLSEDRIGDLNFCCLPKTTLKLGGKTIQLQIGKSDPTALQSEQQLQVMQKLVAAYPGSLAVDEIVATLKDGKSGRRALLEFWIQGAIVAWSEPLLVANSLPERPVAFSISREEARSAADQVTNLHHSSIKNDDRASFLLSKLDGSRTVNDVIANFVEFWVAGKQEVDGTGEGVTKEVEIADMAKQDAKRLLDLFVKVALIEMPT